MDKKLKGVSKFISFVLRHKPEHIGLTLDENGWANVNELLEKSGRDGQAQGITFETLKEIVDTNEKKRFSFNDDFTKIRANQGHTVAVDVELKEATPPAVLYHGTGAKSVESIMQTGLSKMDRLHVHLSADLETAIKVGQRHGKPVVLTVNAAQMANDGVKFYLSENSVWLVDEVPTKYITAF